MTTYESLRASPSPASTKTRPTVTYREFVIEYTSLQRRNALAVAAGVTLVTGAAMRLDGYALLLVAALGLGLILSGLTGLLVAAAAHADYSRRLGVTTSTTYNQPEEARPVRAFIASQNGRASSTVRAGRYSLDRAVWVALFETRNEDDRLTRDAAVKVLPRARYRDWQTTLGELGRLGLVDSSGRITATGWQWYNEAVMPLPQSGMTPAGAHSTPARRTHDAPGASS